MSVDIVFEVLQLVTLLILLGVLISVGQRYPSLVEGNWKMILAGFALFGIGSAFDLADEFITTDAFGTVASIAETTGIATGLLLAALGFRNWFGFMGRFLGASKA